MAAAMTPPRDLFKVALLADANAIAVIRGEPSEDVAMSKHDHRVLKRFGETAGWLGIEFVDYLIVSTSEDLQRPLFHSWNAAGRPC
jgi:DNA repair protein RadC